MNFADYLDEVRAAEFSTEDVLAGFLPLLRQVVETHRAGEVAPLEGCACLHVDGARIWFEESHRLPQRRAEQELDRVAQASRARVDILAERRRAVDVSSGDEDSHRLDIGERGQPLARHVYLPGYVAWEHEVGHHDPLTDVFSLGLILASLACGQNLAEPDDLRAFVEHRRNLFKLRANLHPVLASAILRMTELDRHERAQDLPSLLTYLENYREQPIDLALELARYDQAQPRPGDERRGHILARLRERLFDMSRRNPLLSFRATLQTVNLTHASVPLMFDIRNIREDQVLVWNEKLQAHLAGGKLVSLNKHLNFEEALYLPSLLDRIIADARRDQNEYGFAQLRLVICFLSWANLKERPIERFVSPLVLLPVRLVKNKGVRDTYALEAVESEAEINPVIRQQFRQLYAVELPESVSLEGTALDDFFTHFTQRVQASEPAVMVSRIVRPRIDLVHEKAKRRLEHFRKSARLSGRGVRRFMDLDYSYDPANFHPLGVKLFSAKVKTPSHKLREIIEQTPRPRTYVAPGDSDTVERERSFFQLRDGAEENPYLWNLDFCSLTVANFRYRKMSLVRDYEAIEDFAEPPRAFEATFSLEPRPVRLDPAPPPLAERYDVVACDPTQASAIAAARRGECYIIQGPPGTGKSQTITNLIADFVARGRRVLFVCEKRAAIDVVYARLKQTGLAGLCSLIHDSQTDKKAFVLDLKDIYEEHLADLEKKRRGEETSRDEAVVEVDRQLAPLAAFEQAMEAVPENIGVSMRELLDVCLRTSGAAPQLSPAEAERLPPVALWHAEEAKLKTLAGLLEDTTPGTTWGEHPLRFVQPRVALEDRPLERIATSLRKAIHAADELQTRLNSLPGDAVADPTPSMIRDWLDYAEHINFLAESCQLKLADASSDISRTLVKHTRDWSERQKTVAAAASATTAWREKLPPDETESALAQAKQFEGSYFAWLSPAWWRLRGVLNRSYDFRAHQVAPKWTQILSALRAEQLAEEAESDSRAKLQAEFAFDDAPGEFVRHVDEIRAFVATLPPWLRSWHESLVAAPNAGEHVAKLLAARPSFDQLSNALSAAFVGLEERPLAQIRGDLAAIKGCESHWPDALPILTELAALPSDIATLLRERPWTIAQAEGVIAAAAWQVFCRGQRAVQRFDGRQRERQIARLEAGYETWLDANAGEIRRGAQQRFHEHVQLSGLNTSQLKSDAERDFKKRYAAGRRTLEHEFGKQMRFKSIRELVDGDSGAVIRDLKPVWLMSPLSVSDTLPLDANFFDVVIFDEASQVPLEEAVPSLFRAPQVIVVGDEMQLPPTDFFSASRDDSEDENDDAGEPLPELFGETPRFDLETSSFLNHAARNLPATMLGWHYRSRSESLISYSNHAFYEGRLLTVPDHRLPPREEPPIAHTAPATSGAELLLSRPLSFHLLKDGLYDKRKNRAEADYIAAMVRDILLQQTGRSVGVIAFSEAQQSEIELALERLAAEDNAFREALDAEWEREENGQFVGLLVKNLENIQGDERDIVILSICYGPNPQGKMLMNFGPINKSGGEKRLNVAFSRAKQHMAVVSSIQHAAITNDYNEGANCLKNYLRYAQATSAGEAAGAQRVLHAIGRARDRRESSGAGETLTTQVAAALRERGFVVDEGVGQSHFRVDLAVRMPEDVEHRLGILVDSLSYYRQADLLERDMLRPRLLRAFGWQVTAVLAKDWYEDAATEIERLLSLLADPPSP